MNALMLGLGDEVIAIFAIPMAFVFVIALVVINVRAKARSDRLKLLEQALSNDRLSEDQRRELIESLTGRKQSTQFISYFSEQLTFVARNLLVVSGWLTMFAGIGCMLSGARDWFEGGIVATAVGFGLVTLPMAIREMRSRHHA